VYKTRSIAIADPHVDVQVRQAVNDLAQTRDLEIVWAHPDDDLNEVCKALDVRTVYLYADKTYNTGVLNLTHAIGIVAPLSTVIQPSYGFTGTPKVIVNVPATVAGQPIVTIRGGTWKLPIECNTRVRLIGGYTQTSLLTTNGAKIELNKIAASRSWIDGWESDDTDALGILIGKATTDVRCCGTDFSLHTTAIDAWIATTPHLGPDGNAGTVVLH
jgi:hypothetical protein